MSVYKAIADVSAALAGQGIGKNKRNAAQGYSFRGIDDVLQSLSRLLPTCGLVIIPRVVSCTRSREVNAKGTVLFYVSADVEFDLVSVVDGSKHTARFSGEAMDSGDKATNKAMSAAYKYMALQTFCIPVEGVAIDTESETHEVVQLPTITGKAWASALNAVVTGQRTKAQLLEKFSITAEQDQELESALDQYDPSSLGEANNE
jgi:hypothetical protein